MDRLRYQPQRRALIGREWRSLGLETFTVFQNPIDYDPTTTPAVLNRIGTGHTPVATPYGVGISTQGACCWGLGSNGRIVGTGNQFAVAITFQLNTLGQTNKYLAIDGGGGAQVAVIYGYVANTIEFFAQGFTGTDPRSGSQIVVNDLLQHTVLYTYDGTTFRGFLDGQEKFALARTFSIAPGGGLGYVGGASATTGLINATFYSHIRFSQGLPRDKAVQLSANPWTALTLPDDVIDADADVLLGTVSSGVTIVSAAGSSFGTSSLTTVARAIANAYGVSMGTAGNSASASAVTSATGSSTGASTVSGTTVSLLYSSGSTAGVGSASASSVSVYLTNGTSTSSASVTGDAYAIWNVTGNTSGASGGTGSSAALVTVAGSSTGTSTSSGTGSSLAPSNGVASGTAAGTSTANGVAVSFYNAIANSFGSAYGTGQGVASASAVASASGASTASAGGVILACASGTATGLATVNGMTVAIYGAAGISASAAQVQAIAASVAATIGASQGRSTVSGVTEGGLHYTASGDKFAITLILSPYKLTLNDVPFKLKLN